MSPEEISNTVMPWLQPPFVYLALLCLCLLLVLYVMYAWRKARRGIVPFETEGGAVEISPATVRGIIQHAAVGVEGVERAVSRVHPHGKHLEIQVLIHLDASAKLQTIQQEVRERVRHTLHNQFGFDPTSLQPINIRVTRIVGDLPEGAGDPVRSEAEMVDPYDQLTRFEDDDDGYVTAPKGKRK